ncbi:MAG: hypothetical protein JSV35_00480 [Candidatus Bathyarchaeota archaeon]|nr:MAG: hypothetical protein JSV35_00480 [Candidatus Bathyarchaeota archaeon]
MKKTSDEPHLRIKAEVNSTEDLEKVQSAIIRLFEPLQFQTKTVGQQTYVTAESSEPEPLAKFSMLLQKEQIRSAARRILLQGMTDRKITFFLNKQVASAGHISFCEPFAESPLGPIKVEIDSIDPIELVDWLAPRISQPQRERPRKRRK